MKPFTLAQLLPAAVFAISIPAAGAEAGREPAYDLAVAYQHRALDNPAAYIPPQCYTKTEDAAGVARNPCYVCHTSALRPNYVDDAALQLSYDFSEFAAINRWRNLFQDRSARVAAIGDAEILDYIRTDNYRDEAGLPRLARTLAAPPALWDANANGRWDGYLPDAGFHFDEDGFDRASAGDYTGWRAFAYYPFPGTFWPTNGSTSDVLIRLPEAFRRDQKGRFDPLVYKTNLAIVEALVRECDIPIDSVDERRLGGVDIDKDGKIGRASQVSYDWAPAAGRQMWYVGQAHDLQKKGRLRAAAGLYPEGTEFLHSVRYIDPREDGEIRLAPRLKELRYARKDVWLNYPNLRAIADAEIKERRDFPERLRGVLGDHERGVSNGKGWVFAGFIEDAAGELRPQTYEELVFCVGCHGGIGATRDSIFSFDRKLGDGAFRRGWYHWSQRGLKGLPDPRRKDGRPEYAFYLEQNGAGDEFRANSEVLQRFFGADGALDPVQLLALRNDISTLLWPSPQRALQLNKAYKAIVETQAFVQGRDATVVPPYSVHEAVVPGAATGIPRELVAERLQ